MKKYLNWTTILPIIAWIVYLILPNQTNIFFQLISGLLLIASVLAGVYHSEVIAHKVGEPFGTIILAVSITIIEVSLIVALMISGGEKAIYLARDTIFSSVMIILNAIIGICILVGSSKHYEQFFQKKSVNTALVSLVAILILTLILPNFTTSIAAPKYTKIQLVFVALACLIIYGAFLIIQTIRHKNYFILDNEVEHVDDHENITKTETFFSFLFLVISLAIVVLMAKSLSPVIETVINDANLPQSLVGVIIAGIVLFPEGIAAIKAAYKNDIQTSLNLSFGSALAAIGLTIPSVAIVSSLLDMNIILGLGTKEMILLGLSIFTVMLSLSKGKTNILYGVILLVNFITYIFTIIFP